MHDSREGPARAPVIQCTQKQNKLTPGLLDQTVYLLIHVGGAYHSKTKANAQEDQQRFGSPARGQLNNALSTMSFPKVCCAGMAVIQW